MLTRGLLQNIYHWLNVCQKSVSIYHNVKMEIFRVLQDIVSTIWAWRYIQHSSLLTWIGYMTKQTISLATLGVAANEEPAVIELHLLPSFPAFVFSLLAYRIIHPARFRLSRTSTTTSHLARLSLSSLSENLRSDTNAFHLEIALALLGPGAP